MSAATPSTRLVAAARAERKRVARDIADAEVAVEAARRRLEDLRAYDLRIAALCEPAPVVEDRTDGDDDRDIAYEVAARHGDPEVILGRRGGQGVRESRRATFVDLRALGWSYPRIGRATGRDHTTVHAAVNGASSRTGA